MQPRPSTDGVRPDGGGDNSVNPGTGVDRRGTGVVRRSVNGAKVTPSVRKQGAPEGFEIERVQSGFTDRFGGNKRSLDGRMEPHPDAIGGDHDDGHYDDDHHDDDHHDDGYHDDHHDGHHGGHHGGHYGYNIHIGTGLSYWTHYSYAPYGWWYVWGDYNHDGYVDYVVTNGSYSVYYYGWSGSYWSSSPWYGFYPPRHNYYWWRYSLPDTYRGTVYGVGDELVDEPGPVSVTQMPDEMPEAVPLSAVEVARLEMSIGNPQVAIDAYRAHLSEFPDDWYAMRELGIALIRDGQRGDGIAMIGYAHSQDPLLALDPVPVELFEGDSYLMRDTLVDVVGWAHRNPSASAWLSVAVIMQGEGRNGPALKMIDRAQQHGLDPFVANEMRAALAGR